MIPADIGLIDNKNWINVEASLIGTAISIDIENQLESNTLAYVYKGKGIWEVGLDKDVVTDYPIGIGSMVIIKGSSFLNGIWKVLGCFAVDGGGGIRLQTNVEHYDQSWVESGSATLQPFSDTPLHQTKAGTNIFNTNTSLSGYKGNTIVETRYTTTEYFVVYDGDCRYDWTDLQVSGSGEGSAVLTVYKSLDCVNFAPLVNPINETINTANPTSIISLNQEVKGLFVKLVVTVTGEWTYSVKWKGR